METKPRTRIVAGLAALVALAAITVLSLLSITPPAPKTADAPADEFSAARAYAHVERIGSEVHVAGSPAAAKVRAYIEDTLKGYGIGVQTQDSVGADDALGGQFAMAQVRNVIGTLPGSDPTGTLFLVAHYDSVQVSYGGNDDGAGVATLLETARALAQGPKPLNTIVFVFTDAEEACLCGAEAFKSFSPLAAAGGVVLNFEARGANGPVIMFETSRGNANVVDIYGDSVPYPVGTSFAVEVYRILPNDTDFSPFRDAGRFTGLNSAYIDGSPVYHSPSDKPSYMDKGSLQHHGSNALALARAFGAANIATLSKPSSYDLTYFPVLGYLVRYPGTLVWPIAGLALVGVIAFAVMARRRALTTWPRVAAGFGLGLIPVLLGPVLAQVLWAVLVAIRPEYANMDDPWQPVWYRAGVVALVGLAVFGWYGLFRRRFGAWTLAIGALAWLAVLGLVLAAAAPGGSYLAALPVLAAAVAGIVALSLREGWLRLLVLCLGGVVSVLILAPTVLLFFPALGLATGGAAALFATMLLLAALPVLDYLYPSSASVAEPASEGESVSVDEPAPRRRLWVSAPAAVAGVAALAFVATGLAVDHFDAVHPSPEQLIYALDTDTGKARWVSGDASPGRWSGNYITTREDLSTDFPIISKHEVGTGPAQAAALAAPAVSVLSDKSEGGKRTVTLTLRPQRSVRLIYFQVRDVPVLAATVAGRGVASDVVKGDFNVLFHAPGPDGVTVTLVLGGTGKMTLRVMDGSDGLTGLPGFTPRPADIGVEGSHDSELVLVAKTYTI